MQWEFADEHAGVDDVHLGTPSLTQCRSFHLPPRRWLPSSSSPSQPGLQDRRKFVERARGSGRRGARRRGEARRRTTGRTRQALRFGVGFECGAREGPQEGPSFWSVMFFFFLWPCLLATGDFGLILEVSALRLCFLGFWGELSLGLLTCAMGWF